MPYSFSLFTFSFGMFTYRSDGSRTAMSGMVASNPNGNVEMYNNCNINMANDDINNNSIDSLLKNEECRPIYPSAPPPYTEFADAYTANEISALPPSYSPEDQRNANNSDNSDKEDLDFFRYSAPCKKIATCVVTLVALIVFLIFILLIVYGKL